MLELIQPILAGGFLDGIVKGLGAGFAGLWSHVLTPALAVYYVISFWVPLNIISGIVIIFKFFASSFMANVFGASTNPDGTFSMTASNLTFNFSSQLGYIFIFFFIIAIMLFFINFLYNFSTSTAIDADGKPTKAQSRRLFYLKWPMYMIILLIFTPGIMILVDGTVSLVLRVFDSSSTSVSISAADINNLKRYIVGDLSSNDNYAGKLYGYLNTERIIGSETLKSYLLTLKANINTFNVAINARPTPSSNATGTSVSNQDEIYISTTAALEKCTNAINKILQFANTDYTQNINEAKNIVNGLQPNTYISNENSKKLMAITSVITNFTSSFKELDSAYKTIKDPDTMAEINKLLLKVQAQQNDPQKMTKITAINATLASLETYHANYIDTNSKLYTSFIAKTSPITCINIGDTINNYIGLSELSSRSSSKGLDNSIPILLYQYVTGDPNPNNWQKFPEIFGSSSASEMTVPQYILGGYACFGSLLIIYQYLQATVSRSFYIVTYWVMGWLYLANGIKDPKPAMNWYKQLFGRWLSVIVLYICFSMSCIMLNILKEPIETGLSGKKYALESFKDFNIVAAFGTILALEGLLQMGYTISNTVTQQLWDIKDEKFVATSSAIFTEGRKMANNMQNSVKAVAQTAWNTATFKPVRSAIKSGVEEYHYWMGRQDAEIKWGMQKQQAQTRQDNFLEDQKKARQHGYELTLDKDGNYKNIPIASSKTSKMGLLGDVKLNDITVNGQESNALAINQKWQDRLQKPIDEQRANTNEQALQTQIQKRFGSTNPSIADQVFSPYGVADNVHDIGNSFAASDEAKRKIQELTDANGGKPPPIPEELIAAAKSGPNQAEAYAEKAELEAFMRKQVHGGGPIDEEQYKAASERLERVNGYISDKIHTQDNGMKSELVSDQSWVSNVYNDFDSHTKFMEAAKGRGAFGGGNSPDTSNSDA